MSRRVGGEGGPWMLKQVQHDEGRNGKHPSMKGGRLPLALRPLRIGIAERARLALDLRQAAGVTLYRRSGAALIVLAADILALDRALSLRAGAAVEAMHVYSLIHDDLPCMDDDDMRRGKPTVHRAFDEATAVLAGAQLHALAFEWLVRTEEHTS